MNIFVKKKKKKKKKSIKPRHERGSLKKILIEPLDILNLKNLDT